MVFQLFVWSVCLMTGIVGLFVSVGIYPNHTSSGLNVPECGLEYVAIELDVSFGTKCFYETYPNKTISVINKLSNRKNTIPANRIFNGQDASFGEAPWHILLIHYVGRQANMCSGSLITLEWVLTSAHCLDSLQSGYAYAGSIRKLKGEKKILNAKKLFLHPYYVNPGSSHLNRSDDHIMTSFDIALIKLTSKYGRKVSRQDRQYMINTICLPKPNQTNNKYEWAKLAGFGIVNKTKYEPNILQTGLTQLAPWKTCRIPGTFCTFLRRNDTKGCPGDSGGALYQTDTNDLYRAIIVGVYRGNTISKCDLGSEIDFWVPPSRIIPWILDTIESN